LFTYTLSPSFEWEFIFVRHYVRMWFTSCDFAVLKRYFGAVRGDRSLASHG
jgi:hypothetical protein